MSISDEVWNQIIYFALDWYLIILHLFSWTALAHPQLYRIVCRPWKSRWSRQWNPTTFWRVASDHTAENFIDVLYYQPLSRRALAHAHTHTHSYGQINSAFHWCSCVHRLLDSPQPSAPFVHTQAVFGFLAAKGDLDKERKVRLLWSELRVEGWE